jgi:phasin family protein
VVDAEARISTEQRAAFRLTLLHCKKLSLTVGGQQPIFWALCTAQFPTPERNPTMAEVRPSFFDFDVTKMMTDFRFRPFDVEALMACQRRNIEAFSQANQLAVEGVQAVARRQIEIARQALEDVSVLFRELAQPTSTEDRIAKNTEYAKQMLEKSVNHGREITELAAKAGTEAADVLRKRATESLDELRDMAKQQAQR